MDARRVGRLVRAKRERRRLTQAGLAERVGLSPTSIYRLERGQSIPHTPAFIAICKLLRIGISEL